jgi:hypothetical protein
MLTQELRTRNWMPRNDETPTLARRITRRGSQLAVRSRALSGWFSALALALSLAGCAAQAAVPPTAPSPTIAALPLRSMLPAPGRAATRPPAARASTATPPAFSQPTAAPRAGTPAPLEPFVYLWPAYLPNGMQVSPKESRVPREGEIGQNGQGFFIVTFAAGTGRLVIGGGATDALPLAGDQRRIEVGGRPATLTTNDPQRQVTFDVPKGSLFVYSSILSEDELLRVAGSLQPIDLSELRRRVGAE